MKYTFKKILNFFLILIISLSPVSGLFAEVITAEQQAAAAAAAANVNVGSPFQTNTGNNFVPTGNTYNPQNPYQINTSANTNNPFNPNNTNANNPYNPNINPATVNAQIQSSVLATSISTTTSSTAQTSSVAANATGIASCLGSQIVAQAIVGAVSNYASTAISKVTDGILNVPTAESGTAGASIKTTTSARVGTSIDIFGFSIPALPSWDAMAYCIVNTMIIYIADSTIQWINTGFDGNPAFLNDPGQFFEDLANQEKVAFLQGIAYGVNSSVCGVFKSSVVSAILSRYGKNQQYGQQGYQTGGYGGGVPGGISNGCPFDNRPGQINAFLTGGFSQGGGWDTWFQVTQNPVSNPYDTYFNANDRMNSQAQAIKISNERELNWNNGYLSFRTCSNGEKDKSKCPVTTPGTVIQNQLNSTLNLGKNRLVLAEKFDQVVTAVVDQLITTAIDKALDRESYSSSNVGYGSSVASATTSRNPWTSTSTVPYTGQSQQNQNSASSTNQNITTMNGTGTYVYSTTTKSYIYIQQ